MRDVDELVLLDVTASFEERCISPEMVHSVANSLSVPLAVGGGVRTLADFEATLRSGADKVVLGASAALNPSFIAAAAERFGAQAVVIAVDVFDESADAIAINGGTTKVAKTPVEFAVEVVAAGAGEILLQSVARDGMLVGMDLRSIEAVAGSVGVPVIASSGAGSYQHLLEAFNAGADAVAAGAMFQFTEQTPRGARNFLASEGVSVRMAE
jgi:imidazole glycerol-phosphate synthase subunit HisF